MTSQLKIGMKNGAHQGRRILHLSGRLSIETVPEFLQVLRAEKSPAVILDIGELNYIDSAGVGALIQMHVAYQKSGQSLALAAVGPRVAAVLEIARVKNIFRSYPTLEAAEEGLG